MDSNEFLELTFDKHMNWEEHVIYLALKLAKWYTIRIVKQKINQETAKSLY